MNKSTKIALVYCMATMHIGFQTDALAVGNGLAFDFDEMQIPGALNNIDGADSVDFTYHACTDVAQLQLQEKGYFWISSYQDANTVIDSQINYIGNNGYHVYGKYSYQALQIGGAQNSISGQRLNYRVRQQNALIQLYVDPDQDTQLSLNGNCDIVVANNGDDWLIGQAQDVTQGEKSETNGLAQGDFKVVFNNWMWNPVVPMLMQPVGMADFNYFVFNGNITDLGGALGDNHRPEGSGNVFWLEYFQPVIDQDQAE